MDPQNSLYVSKVIHKAMIEVNEEGAEAAAATAVVTQFRCMPMTMQINCNRPFVYFIGSVEKQEVLFMGKVVNPSKN